MKKEDGRLNRGIAAPLKSPTGNNILPNKLPAEIWEHVTISKKQSAANKLMITQALKKFKYLFHLLWRDAKVKM